MLGLRRLVVLASLCPLLASAQQMTRPVGALPTPRQMHGAVVLGDHLYVVGGELGAPGDDAYWTDTVLSARIAEDGTLGEWTPNRSLPKPRAYITTSTVGLNDRVYVGGGSYSEVRFRTVLMAAPGADGQLTEWIESAPYSNRGMACFPMVPTPGWLHILGGSDGQAAQRSVISGRLAPDGTVAEWVAGPDLPNPLWFHCGTALGGRVWVWGGATARAIEGNINASVCSAPILADGRLGDWRTESTSLEQPFYTAACATAGPFVVSFAPRYGKTTPSNDIWHAKFDEATGTIGGWRKREGALPVRLYVPVAPDYRRGFMYIPGGRIAATGENSVEKQVFLLTLNQGLRSSEEGATTSAYTYQLEDKLSSDALPGFASYASARKAAETLKRPLVLYFHNATSRGAIEQRDALSAENVTVLEGQAALAWIDTRDWPQMSRELGVYKVPTWIVYDAAGKETHRVAGRMTVEELGKRVAVRQ